MARDAEGFHHTTQHSAQFKTFQLFTSGIFNRVFSDPGGLNPPQNETQMTGMAVLDFHSVTAFSGRSVFLFLFRVSSVTRWLVRSTLFNFQMFVDFSDVFLLLISSLYFHCGQRMYSLRFQFSYFNETCFMTQSPEAVGCDTVAVEPTFQGLQELSRDDGVPRPA